MNATDTQDPKHQLLDVDHHFRDLAEQHHQLDEQLHQYTDRHYLSNSEQLEESTLKKRKLALKDQMEAMARDYARSHG